MKKISILSGIALYLQQLKNQHYSVNTIVSRKKLLGYYLRFCSGKRRPYEAKTIEAYQTYLSSKITSAGTVLSAETMHNRLDSVLLCMRFLHSRGHLPSDPTAAITLPRLPRKIPRHILTHAEIALLIKTPDTTSPSGLAMRAIIEVFAATGIRRNELCNLHLDDVDYTRKTILIRSGKGNKDRLVPCSKQALDWLKRYLDEVRPKRLKSPEQKEIFVNLLGHPVQPGNLSARIRALIVEAGISKPGACHQFRHAFATDILIRGCPIRHLQSMLGHSCLESTSRYTHLSIQDVQKAYEKFHRHSSSSPAWCYEI